MFKKYLWAVCMSITSTAVFAQGMTMEQLRAAVDKELSKDDELVAMLSDPDPKRAQATMKVMLDSGDPDMQRIALENGIYSADPNVRGMAVKAFLDSEPLIEVQIDGSKAKTEDFRSVVKGSLGLVPNDDAQTIWIGKFQRRAADGTCYAFEHWPSGDECLFRAVGGALQLKSSDRNWYEMNLTDDGRLQAVVGAEYAGTSTRPIILSIPIR
ncbi:hypothetical protein [Salipiger abyssi]|uniref:hypothetical protein n=1 Tax=Salipiger abyssi TaxID=1250539 RepID=UPI001A8ED637|nr:hypothetical protein [Salipiger abyssi]MBN9890574.1 hypothetical protein [Salipiger abyssi]